MLTRIEGLRARRAAAKTRCYQRKCKIFFCWTRKIQYQTVLPPNFKQFGCSCRSRRAAAREKCGAGAGLGGGAGQGAQILYNYRKGAIRVAGESPDKKWIWCIEWWILKFLYWKRPRVSTTRDGCILFYSFVLYLSRIRIEVEIVVIIRNVNIQKFYLFGNIDFKILVFCPPDKAGFIWYEGELNAVYLIEVCFLQLFDFLF